MKKLLVLVILLLSIWVETPSAAAENDSERGLTIEMGFSLSRTKGYDYDAGLYYTGGKNSDHIIAPMFIPRIGYRFNPQWTVGLMYINNTINDDRKDNHRYNSFGAFVERNCFSFVSGRISFFTDLQYLYNHTLSGNNFTECGLVPGLAFHISGSPVDIKLRYLFVGFNDCHSYLKGEWGGCLGRGNFILDAGLQRLQIGAALTF